MKAMLTRDRRSRATDLALYPIVAIVLIAIPQFLYGFFYAVHHDLAGAIMSGGLAYSLDEEFFNYNLYFPPVERVWFSMTAWLSNKLALRVDLTVMLLVSIAIFISVVFAYSIRRTTVGASPLFLIIPALIFLALPILFKNIFGLREHMVALGLWPYLVLRVSDPENQLISWKTRALLGLWLGTTLTFKYLYSLVVLLLEIADSALQRRFQVLFRQENLTAGAVVGTYLFLWLGLDSSQREAITTVLSGMEANLQSTETNWLTALKHLPLATYFLFAAWVFNWPLRRTVVGLALVSGAVLAAAIQARWYTHHVFPITLAYIAWWWMVRRYVQWWGHIAVALLITMSVVPQFRSTSMYQDEVRELDAALQAASISMGGKRVGMLSVHPSPFNQYFASHGAQRWNASVNNAYVPSELASLDTKDNLGRFAPPIKLKDPGRRYLHDEMLRLWEDMPPDAMIFDDRKSWPLRHLRIDWMQVFAEDARFQAVMTRYEPLLVYRGERLDFTYYARKDD